MSRLFTSEWELVGLDPPCGYLPAAPVSALRDPHLRARWPCVEGCIFDAIMF